MKTTLPEKSRSHEAVILEIKEVMLQHHRDKIAFIILFGSFARGDWVYDYYTEDGRDYEFASDYDFLILTKKNKHGSGHGATNFKHDLSRKLKSYKRPYHSHTPTLIIESVDRVNKELEKGQYFFSDIRKEGILLYTSDEFELKEAKELSSQEVKAIAREHFEQWFEKGTSFLKQCQHAIKDEDYTMGAFLLHQATESFLNCALLVLTGYKPKLHDIEELLALCASQSNAFLTIFPLTSQAERENFELLKKAYIDARYSKDYVITHDQLDQLLQQVVELSNVVDRLCRDRVGGL